MEFIGKEYMQSFNELYSKYYKLMLYVANQKLGGNFHASEDVVQNSLVSISNKSTYEIIEQLSEDKKKSYIISIVKNKAIDYYRKEMKYVPTNEDEITRIREDNTYRYYDEDILKKFIIKMELLDILQYISTMSASEQRLFRLLLIYDMKIKDMATNCNMTVSGVRKKLARTRIKIRRYMNYDQTLVNI